MGNVHLCQRLSTSRDHRRNPPSSSNSGFLNVALAGCHSSCQSDLVRADNLPVINMWIPDEDDVWSELDEGCNSTCHSKGWGELAEDTVTVFDLTFSWVNSSTKNFAGLGSSTGRETCRLAFKLVMALAGAVERHEVDTDAYNPLLISLFTQAR